MASILRCVSRHNTNRWQGQRHAAKHARHRHSVVPRPWNNLIQVQTKNHLVLRAHPIRDRLIQRQPVRIRLTAPRGIADVDCAHRHRHDDQVRRRLQQHDLIQREETLREDSRGVYILARGTQDATQIPGAAQDDDEVVGFLEREVQTLVHAHQELAIQRFHDPIFRQRLDVDLDLAPVEGEADFQLTHQVHCGTGQSCVRACVRGAELVATRHIAWSG